MDSLVNKPLRSCTDEAHKQVSSKYHFDYTKVSVCSQMSPSDTGIKEISLWYGVVFIPPAMEWKCWEQRSLQGKNAVIL